MMAEAGLAALWLAAALATLQVLMAFLAVRQNPDVAAPDGTLPVSDLAAAIRPVAVALR